MIPVPAGVRVWLASGVTDMRKGWGSLSLLVQEQLKLNPHCGHLFVFRGRQGGLVEVIWHDGQGACLFTKKLEQGRFIWPFISRRSGFTVGGAARLSSRRDRLAHAAKNMDADCGGIEKSTGRAPANMILFVYDRSGRSAPG